MFWVKLAFKSLFQRRKISYLMVLIISISMVFLIMVNSATEEILKYTKEKAYEKYGEHHAIINNLSEKEFRELKGIHSVKKGGGIFIVGYTEDFNESSVGASIGWFDKSALELGHIHILHGRMPVHKNEIAIESFLTDSFKTNDVIGADVKLKIGAVEEVYQIVGIVNNYSSNWSTPINIEKGKNTYPNVFISPTKFNADKHIDIQKSFIFSLQNENVEKIEQEINENFEQHLSSPEQLYENENLFNEGYKNYNRIFYICLFFSIILIFGSLCCCFRIFEVFYQNYRQKIAILRSHGAKKNHIRLLVFFQSTIIVLVSFLISFPVGVYLKKILNHQTYRTENYSSSPLLESTLFVTIWLTLLFFSLCITALIVTEKISKETIHTNLKGNPLIAKGYRVYQFIEKFPFKLKSLVIQLTFRWKSSILFIVILSFSIMIFFFTQLIADETIEKSEETTPDFILSSKQLTAEEHVNGYIIETNQSVSFDYKSVEDLQRLPGVVYIDKVPNSLGSTLLLTKQQLSPNIKSWINTYKLENINVEISEDTIDNLVPNNLIPIPNVNFVLVNDSELKHLQRMYSFDESSVRKVKKSRSAFIFFPEINQKEMNNKIINGDEVKIGRIAYSDEKKPKFENWDLKVERIILSPYLMKQNQISQEREGITVLIYEEVAKKIGVFDGYKELTIYTDHSISKQKKKGIINKTKQMVSSIPGSLYYSETEDNKRLESISNYLSILGTVLFAVTAFYSVLTLAATMYSRIIQRKAEIAINRAFGKSVTAVLKDLIIEMTIYLILAFLLSGTIILFLTLSMPENYNNYNYFKYYFYSVAFTSTLSLLSLSILFFVLKKISISDALKTKEE
ncbi:ABC transporter permease [Bacillus paralicheniformis]|uniref:ABC transporter permease n=1 Tax=Bacillus paralicheniformis TaxID=1648923 RepID=UPI001B13A250|nr:ABC transporter permease [Bacillus paralicheniformis]GIN46392.1 hypothetical protein J23TS8_39590 [Bacillus paralicheniformis]